MQLCWAYFYQYKVRFRKSTIKSVEDLAHIKRVKNIRFFYWNLIILDVCLYAKHEILHHKLFLITERNFFSLFSYFAAFLTLFLSVFEFTLIARYIYKFYYNIESYVISDITSGTGSGASRALGEIQMVSSTHRRVHSNSPRGKARI